MQSCYENEKLIISDVSFEPIILCSELLTILKRLNMRSLVPYKKSLNELTAVLYIEVTLP